MISPLKVIAAVGVGGAAIGGAMMMSSSDREDNMIEIIENSRIEQVVGEDTFIYPTLEDAAVITNIPADSIREMILNKEVRDSVEFRISK